MKKFYLGQHFAFKPIYPKGFKYKDPRDTDFVSFFEVQGIDEENKVVMTYKYANKDSKDFVPVEFSFDDLPMLYEQTIASMSMRLGCYYIEFAISSHWGEKESKTLRDITDTISVWLSYQGHNLVDESEELTEQLKEIDKVLYVEYIGGE